jgi:hypothetical protein
VTRWLWVLGVGLSVTALAGEPEVQVQADVVYAATSAGAVDPALEKMRATLAPKVKYLTLKKLDSKTLQLIKDAPRAVVLPNHKSAELTLQGVKDNVATLKVRVAPTEAIYSLGRDKSLYLQGGEYQGGDVWLVISQPK